MKRSEKFKEYLQSQEWQEKRLQVFAERWRKCEKCGSDQLLHIHHWTYTRVFKEKLSDLFILCGDCHTDLHKKHGTKDLLRATKSYILWVEYIPQNRKKRKTKKQRRALRTERLQEKIRIYGECNHPISRTRVTVEKILSKKFAKNGKIEKNL